MLAKQIRFFLSGLLVGAFVFSVFPAAKSHADQHQVEMEEVVVEEGREQSMQRRLPGSLDRQGANVDVITAEEIEESGATDLRQALQRLAPGVHIEGINRTGSGAVNASFRGGGDQEFIMLLDGVRIEPRTFFGFHLNIGPQQIERIEILKDGQSLFYGTNAQVGVINFITKDFDYTENAEFMVEGGNSAGDRSHEELNLGGHVNVDAGENHRVQFFGSQNRSTVELFNTEELSFPAGARTEFENNLQSIGAQYRWVLEDDEYLHLFLNRNELRQDGIPTGFGDPERLVIEDDMTRQDIAYLEWNNQIGGNVFSVRAFWNEQRGDQLTVEREEAGSDTVFVERSGNLSRDYGVHSMAELNGFGGSWTVGSEIHRQEGFNLGSNTLTNPGFDPETSVDPFVQFRPELPGFPNTNLSLGARYNWNDKSDNAVVWQVLGRHWLTEDLSLRGSVGTSFQVPRSADIVDEEFEVIVDAGPETSIGFDLGLESASLPLTEASGNVSLNVFWREITDRIDDKEFSDTDTLVVFNVDNPTTIRGIEGQLNVVPLPNWSLDLSATYSGAYVEEATGLSPDGAEDQLEDIPEFFAKAQIGWNSGNRRNGVRLNAVYTGDVFTDVNDEFRNRGDYTLVHLTGFRYLDSEQNSRLRVRVENLFDRDHATTLDTLDSDGSVFQQFGMPRAISVSYSQKF